jgi:hypothetical protein
MGITITEAVDAVVEDVTEVAEVAERVAAAAVAVLRKKLNRRLHQHHLIRPRRVIPNPRRSIVRSQSPNALGPLTLPAMLSTTITDTEDQRIPRRVPHNRSHRRSHHALACSATNIYITIQT